MYKSQQLKLLKMFVLCELTYLGFFIKNTIFPALDHF